MEWLVLMTMWIGDSTPYTSTTGLYLLVASILFLDTLLALSILGLPLYSSTLLSIVYTVAITYCSKSSLRVSSRVYVNLGGFIAPAILSLYMLYKVLYLTRIYNVLLLLLLEVVIAYIASSYIEGFGVGVPLLLLVVACSSLTALYVELNSLDILYSIPLSYTTSCISTIVGVDILKATLVAGRKNTVMEYGGRGLLDLVVLTPALTPPITIALLIIGNT